MSAKVESSPASAKKAKSGGKAKRKSSASSADHPKVSEMVLEAIANLKERNGSSLQAIKKYIAANFAVDAEKVAPFIRRYLKTQVTSGTLVQTKGKGASGSFKLSGGGGSAVPTGPRKRPSAAVRAAAAAVPRPPKPEKVKKAPKNLAKEKTKRSPKKAKAPKPKKASPRKGRKGGNTPKQQEASA